MEPVYLKVQPIGRQLEREALKELKTIRDRLSIVEENFYLAIFEFDFDYLPAYQECLRRYTKACEWIQNNQKPRWCIIDEYYFEKMFKPVENF